MADLIDVCRQNLRVKITQNKLTTEKHALDVIESRRKMSHSLDMWFRSLGDFMPSDAIQELQRSTGGPENAVLGLPSDFPLDSHRRLGLEDLAIIECQLRVGQAHDALKKLRTALGLKSFLVRQNYNKANDHGHSVYTRSRGEIEKATRQVQKWKEVYQRSYKALEHLRGDAPILVTEKSWLQLKPLSDSDCIMLSEWLEDHRQWQRSGEIPESCAASRGKGKKRLAWFWKLEFTFDDGGTGGDNIQNAVDGWTAEGEKIEKYISTMSEDYTSHSN